MELDANGATVQGLVPPTSGDETAPSALLLGSPELVDDGERAALTEDTLDYVGRNKAAWERWASMYAEPGRKSWQDEEIRWGIWGIPESALRLLGGLTPGMDVVEMGCGTGSLCASLSRQGFRPVGVDFAVAQLATVYRLQREFDIEFRLVCANAEELPIDDASFDVVVSEYGTSLWCNPRRWLGEARRLLRPNGRLIFVTNSTLLMACTPADGGVVGARLVRDYFSIYRMEFSEAGPVEFHPTHGQWIRLLRSMGFVVEDLIETRPMRGSTPRFDFVSVEWARCWPSEEIWMAARID